MNKPLKDFIADITAAVDTYIADEECYTDNVQLQIDTLTGEICIADTDNDLPSCDYYPVMDLVRMSVVNPGQWEPDIDAIADVAASYVSE